ncbi:flagellar protein FliS [Paenibacillus forsythiae]|uniref:Flagellar protein FliS n=1 Tax=Paenibacillus forsythiae TaxID=365616 RepID=A0ABU3HB02_9BACL|nr:flagellar export chaperone FliS [Paenibacillus forsythiae]MDT3428006.1 flagellar protein FliS [Paenibacillus forsythiae]
MLISPYDKYKEAQTQTANSSKLLLMLYDGAIRFLKLGIEGIEQGNIEKANNNLIKTQAIINELVASLNLEYPIAHNLAQIYEYMIYQLIQANIKKDKQCAEEVLTHLIDMKEAWIEASRVSGM